MSGGANRSAVGVTALVDEAALEQRGVDRLRVAPSVELGGEQQALAAHRGDAGESPEPALQVRALLGGEAAARRCGASRR